MKNLSSAFLTTLIIALTLSCKDEITKPEEPPAGRRDYVWTVDTLKMPPPANILESIWGNSPNDIWATASAGDNDYGLWHYDGSKWNVYANTFGDKYELTGSSSNDIWFGSNDGRIYHYDGNTWTKNYTYERSDATITDIKAITSKAKSDVYASGYCWLKNDEGIRSFLLRYDGLTWREVYKSNFRFYFSKVLFENDELFVAGSRPRGKEGPVVDTLEIYTYKEGALKALYSNTSDKIVWISFNRIGDQIHFVLGKEIHVYKNGFTKVLSIDDANFGYQIYGRSQNDMFLRMKDGLAHYNGTNIEYLYRFPLYQNSIMATAAIYGKEVFFLMNNIGGSKAMILHGKLKE